MQANRRVSGRELELRAAVRRAGGTGYRVTARLPGHPDLAFPGVRLAVFMHGCFWHRCPECELPVPAANRVFWMAKFAANAERDRRVIDELAARGWTSRVVWEHELRLDPDATARTILKAVAELRATRSGSARTAAVTS